MTNYEAYVVTDRMKAMGEGLCPHKYTHKTFEGCVKSEMNLIASGRWAEIFHSERAVINRLRKREL